jgi:hypothetical protein
MVFQFVMGRDEREAEMHAMTRDVHQDLCQPQIRVDGMSSRLPSRGVSCALSASEFTRETNALDNGAFIIACTFADGVRIYFSQRRQYCTCAGQRMLW